MKLWTFWNFETLKLWNFETLKLWNFETLKLLKFWNFETLKSWNFQGLKFYTLPAPPPPRVQSRTRPSPGHGALYTAGPKSIKIHVKTLKNILHPCSGDFCGWPERTSNDGATFPRYINVHNANLSLTLSGSSPPRTRERQYRVFHGSVTDGRWMDSGGWFIN